MTDDVLDLHYKPANNNNTVDEDLSDDDHYDLTLSSTWTLVASNVTKVHHHTDHDRITYLIYSIRIQRRFSFFSLVMLLPCVLLAALTLTIFWLSPQTTDKMSMGMAIWTCFCVILLILVEVIPGNGNEHPMIGFFFVINLVLVTVTMIVTVITNRIREADTPVSPWLKMIAFSVLSPLLCMKMPCKQKASLIDPAKSGTVPGECLPDVTSAPNTEDQILNTALNTSDPLLAIIRHKQLLRMRQKETKEKIEEERRKVAAVFDCLFFWLFLIGLLGVCYWIGTTIRNNTFSNIKQ
ncbi:neuronal acetylcholine receptor subunit alpha-5-like [Lingula anatina]|uniref:Neuronal acetylcholine receptor subunit alpha-5-like n=1 Tax=Lingula anatina TaxID=7574 RepID=A0A1S3I224_LINAN|nr:neuronal acetylcholine receptor subunit alpha-5-like [Lingula anatina]|eukprot:XP_013391399.1 neuronal acetylcholine receptor subunit alpha-5-like [Lingula anatina]